MEEKTRRAEDPTAGDCPDNTSLLTRPLGLFGWGDLEAPLLAALVTEEPLLLIGLHGTAKSYLLQRLAQALKLEFRFYNASLLNYDDLVGVPIPNETRTALHYISTPTAIWDAEVVFIDEINRTRPDLQNKLFPLIHERMVQGIPLKKLIYRWSAMNPSTDSMEWNESEAYHGADPLDPALADRFSFIIQVPDWSNLSGDEKQNLLMEQFTGRHEFESPVEDLVTRAKRLYAGMQENAPAQLGEYLVFLAEQLLASGTRLSPRRLATMMRNILSVHAARTVLKKEACPDADHSEIDWKISAWTAIRHSMPALAHAGDVDFIKLFAEHKQAWELAELDDNSLWHSLLRIGDPVDRLAAAMSFDGELPMEDLGTLVIDALASHDNPLHRTAFSLALHEAFKKTTSLPPTVIESLAGELSNLINENQELRMTEGDIEFMMETYPAKKARKTDLYEIITEMSKEEDPRLRIRNHYACCLMFMCRYSPDDPNEIRRLFISWYDRFTAIGGRITTEEDR